MITLGLRLVQPSSPPSYLAHLSGCPQPPPAAVCPGPGLNWRLDESPAPALISELSSPAAPLAAPPPPALGPHLRLSGGLHLRTLPFPHRVPCCPFCSSALCTHHSLPFVSLPGRVEASGRQGSCSIFILRAQNNDWQVEGTYHCLLNE